jgi:hypothetical protein
MFAFADDGNIMTTMNMESLSKIKCLLSDFGKLSGLECNVEKTTLMQIGSTDPISDEIRSLGFEISNSITVLGLQINGDLLDFHCFAGAYEAFICGFTKHNENFWTSPVFENRALFLRLRDKVLLTSNFFEQDFWEGNKSKILKLTVQDFYLNKENLKTWAQFKDNTGLELDREDYSQLKIIASNAKLKYCKKELKEKKTVDFQTYLACKVKGCKRYRRKILGPEPEFVPHNLIKFSGNTETIIDFVYSRKINSVWNKLYFSNATRTFLFKLHNNTAGYNNTVAHFI